MNWITDRFSTIGGAGGGIVAYIMNISFLNTAEIALSALIGSLIGEGIKELFSFFHNRKNDKDGK
jgi:hypothetical protein